MKAINKFLLTILVLVLMVGCGFCGYFLRDVIPANEYSVASAKEVINKVANAGGFINNDELTTNEIVYAGNYNDYSGTAVDYNGKEAFIKTFVSLFYYAVDGELNAGTSYISSAKYRMGAVEVEGEMTLYIDLTKTQAFFYITDVKSNAQMVMVVSSENNTIDSYQIEGYMSSTFSAKDGLVYFLLGSDNEKITRFAYGEVEWTNKKISDKGIVADDIRSCAVFDCDLSTNRIMNKNQSDMTDTEKVDLATNAIKELNKVRFLNLIYQDFKEVDFLSKAYRNLGYDVVE